MVYLDWNKKDLENFFRQHLAAVIIKGMKTILNLFQCCYVNYSYALHGSKLAISAPEIHLDIVVNSSAQ